MRASRGTPVAMVLLVASLTPGEKADASDAAFTDRVGTLSLSAELDSRGSLGGVCVDRLGFVYVANFRDKLWRIDPEGEVTLLSDALYGASGNAVDSRGRLYQSNFQGHTISRIWRDGRIEPFATDGLQGPVGIAINAGDSLFVCNCQGNTISRVTPEGRVELFATHPSFACPNGIVLADDGNLYVASFQSHDLVRITPDGETSVFVTIPGGAGNTHLTVAKGFLFLTKLVANRVVKVSLDTGEVTSLAGTGQPGHADGPAPEATFSSPNGIAASPSGDRLYLNTLVGERGWGEPTRISVRTIELVRLADLLRDALDEAGDGDPLAAMRDVYHRYRADPVRGQENTLSEMITFGYDLLSSRRLSEAVTVFRLNAESYPDVAAAHYHLGEAYRYSGQSEKAASEYERVLEIAADHALARARLDAVRAALEAQ